MKKIIFSLVLCVMLGSLRATPAPLTIGAIYNLTGTQSALDVPSSQGALLAVSQINKAGGLLGRPIKLIVKNGQSNPIVINKIADERYQLVANNRNDKMIYGDEKMRSVVRLKGLLGELRFGCFLIFYHSLNI